MLRNKGIKKIEEIQKSFNTDGFELNTEAQRHREIK